MIILESKNSLNKKIKFTARQYQRDAYERTDEKNYWRW